VERKRRGGDDYNNGNGDAGTANVNKKNAALGAQIIHASLTR